MGTDVFTPSAKMLAYLGGLGELTKKQLVERVDEYKTVRGLSTTINKLVADGLVVIDSSAKCPHCGETLPGFTAEPGDSMITLTITGRIMAETLYRAKETLSLSIEESEATPPDPSQKDDLEEAKKKKTLADLEKLRVPPGICPVCRKGTLKEGGCDSCGWDEAEGVTCHGDLVRPLENLEVCMSCLILEPGNEQPCGWLRWVDPE